MIQEESIHFGLWISKGEKQKELELRLYAPESEVIRLTFNPLKMSDEPNWNPQWEEWTCYATSLVIYKQDYLFNSGIYR